MAVNRGIKNMATPATTPIKLGFLVNEGGEAYGTVYLSGTGAVITPDQDVWEQDCEMTQEEFQKNVQEGWARAL